MSLETFLGLTPDQTISAWHLWKKQKEEDSKRTDLTAWQIARWQSWVNLYPPEMKEASQFDILKLEGDDELKEYLKKKKEQVGNKPERDERRFRALAKKWG
ncbi:hypothetical protein C8N47_11179 [Mangrovibacterium marinum]|uniref:Uncharacterized protein n=1 Tax=Mangrovibacterium marinum TaxID=1639118 RepID=A0A2T5C0C4_9BACT|nr:hypothetical protein [Mangrovibacterium marinum]PTN08039.1 hypothetical protein C8N47_11179 [Mangrovibacterium marinum]